MDDIPVPSDILRREFGYQTFNITGMQRHVQIRDKGELRVMLLRHTPSDFYCSNGHYSFPTLPMKEKDWQGADLIFDIDAKDLALPCRDKHVLYVCDNCGHTCKSAACELCGHAGRVKQRSLPCNECMNSSKHQVRSLVDVLCDDLGVSYDEITIYFSGNDGFHLHVDHAAFRGIDKRARADLVDYITLNGLLPESMGMKKNSKFDKNDLPDLSQSGWRGRFAKAAFGSKTRRATLMSEFKKLPEESRYSKFQDMIKDAIDKIGIRIDPNVTVDIHRVFRMSHTVNSKSGMIKAPCTDDIDAFDPYVHAVISDTKTVSVTTSECPVKFRLNDTRMGRYKNGERVDLPKYAATYLLCKGLAHIPESS